MRITDKQYAQTLYDLTDGKTNPEIEKAVVDFARYIYRNRKLKLADKIIEQFGKVYNQKKGIVEAEVVTAQKLESSLAHKVESYIKEKYLAYPAYRTGRRQAGQAKEVILKNVIDKSVRGGLIIKVEDEVIDGSVKGKLEELRKVIAG